MLVEMSTTHIPVLAGELVDLLDPQPGEVAIDCTFGGGGHARLVAERLGPGGELIAIDRDPAAEERFAEFAADVACRTRFIHAPFADALADYGEERYARPIARALVRARAKAPLHTTNELVEVVVDAIPAPARFAGGH